LSIINLEEVNLLNKASSSGWLKQNFSYFNYKSQKESNMQADIAILLQLIPVQEIIGKSGTQQEQEPQVSLVQDVAEHAKQGKRDFSAFYDCV
jgi:hypothetical protein